ncbi:MAG: hypothetical protein KAW12_21900 [Candidatus Aminicenantes bacterium]|nr:hypothetical protein [Candidatus Aminicenantes bacterium]
MSDIKNILEGILRFVSSKYPTYSGVNGMIAFLVKPVDIEKNINRINELCAGEFPQTKTEQEIRSNIKPFLYESIHIESKTGKQIRLYHLMTDFSIVSRASHRDVKNRGKKREE